MAKQTQTAFVLPSTHYAMEAEMILTKGKFSPKLVPLPPALGMGCGTAVVVTTEDEEKAQQLLTEKGVPILHLLTITTSGALILRREYGDFCDIY